MSAARSAANAKQTHLLLHERELVEVAREEVHLALLRLAVRVAREVAVVLARLVQRDLELDDLSDGTISSSWIGDHDASETHLLAAILQVAHQALLHRVKVGELLRDGFVLAFHVLGGLLEVLAALDACRRDLERALQNEPILSGSGLL